jgi:hypothetical protein
MRAVSRVWLLAVLAFVGGAARAGEPPACDPPATIGAALVAAWKAELARAKLPEARPRKPARSFAELVESRDRSSRKAPPPAEPGENDATCTK